MKKKTSLRPLSKFTGINTCMHTLSQEGITVHTNRWSMYIVRNSLTLTSGPVSKFYQENGTDNF